MKKKKALITGISGQDGSYLAEYLLEQDYEVFGIIRRHSLASTQETRIDHLVGKGLVKTDYADLLDASSLHRLMALIKPDEIYNLAAQSHVRVSFDVPQFTMQTNMFGTYYCTKNALPSMIKNRWGRIINVSSVVGLRGNIGQSNYSASKAAVHGFSQSLAKEVAKRGITVNVVAPGYIKTATSDVLNEKQKETVLTWIPQGRFGEPDEVAPTIAFLTTKEAEYITGTIIRVDGGMAI